MIFISNRERNILKDIFDELHEGNHICISNSRSGRDLTYIEESLIRDILAEYIKGDNRCTKKKTTES